MKTNQREYSLTLVRFLTESEIKNPLKMADILDDLHRCETSLHRYNEIECERDLTESEAKRLNNIENKVKRLAAELGFNYRLNSDPRGLAICFVLPSGRHNSWDGETWRLNW